MAIKPVNRIPYFPPPHANFKQAKSLSLLPHTAPAFLLNNIPPCHQGTQNLYRPSYIRTLTRGKLALAMDGIHIVIDGNITDSLTFIGIL